MISRYLILCFFYFSCSGINNKQIDLSRQDSLNKNTPERIQDVRGCILRRDILFPNGNYIKYIVFKSYYDVQVGISKIDTLLGFRFNCTSPQGLVPICFLRKKNSIFLVCGSGQYFREIIICELISDTIYISRFESEISPTAEYDFAYKEYGHKSKLILQNRISHKVKSINIPFQYIDDSILKTEIDKSHIGLYLLGKGKITLPL